MTDLDNMTGFSPETNKCIHDMVRTATKRIPWYKMPTKLRSLPFEDREKALADYEAIHGTFDWHQEMCSVESRNEGETNSMADAWQGCIADCKEQIRRENDKRIT